MVGESLDMTAWAKMKGLPKPYPLVFHLLDTAAAALVLWDRFLTAGQRRSIAKALRTSEEHAKDLVAFWAGSHDIAKLTPDFQSSSDAWELVSPDLRDGTGQWRRERHDRAGQLVAPSLLEPLGYDFDDGDCDSVGWRVAQIIGGHHGRFQYCDYDRECAAPRALNDLGGDLWRAQRARHIEVVLDLLGRPAPPPDIPATTAVQITGLVILADWLVSQEEHLTRRQRKPAADLAEHFSTSQREAVRLVGEAGLDASGLGWRPLDFHRMFGIEHPNPLQRSVLDELPAIGDGPGIMVVATSTGDGKTEIALAAQRLLAERSGADGIFFGLPTMATSDQMYLRVRRYTETATSGPAAVTLAHSMAWLNYAYTNSTISGDERVVTADIDTRTAAPRWLRGAKRPMLARIGVGTFDQALAAVLPVKHNALRILALSGKTLVIDEAHAVDPYMQALLQRLLSWLAAYGCPVILLSATLPGSTVNAYVRSYLRGAGWRRDRLPKEPYTVDYPGWVYVDAASAKATSASPAAIAVHRALRRTSLRVDVRAVRHHGYEPGKPLLARSRLAAISDELRGLAEDGGTAAIVCTTVADAQQTFEYLRDTLGNTEDGPEIKLLHARFPADEREATTSRLMACLGRSGPRPSRPGLVVIATQVIEQSLDIDVDLLISDLAPISLLLQRAGRCWRHEKTWSSGQTHRPGDRPGWSSGARLIVLVPSNDDGALSVPKAWGTVYHEYLLDATHRQLARLAGADVSIPDDVQALVEEVYGPGSEFNEEAAKASASGPSLAERRTAWDGETLAQRTIADCVIIPAPTDVRDLSVLHERSIDESMIGTRLGIDSIRVVCCFEQPDGRNTLDREGAIELPQPEDGKFSAAEIRTVMSKTIPTAVTKLVGRSDDTNPPPSWREHSWLGDLVLLPHRKVDGRWLGPTIGRHTFQLDRELGLVIDDNGGTR